MLIDSHCHLDRLNLDQLNLDAALKSAAEFDINYFLCPGVDLAHTSDLVALAKKYPEKVVLAIGSHPTEEIDEVITAEKIIALVKNEDVSFVHGIGETGLDFYHLQDNYVPQRQIEKFRAHIHAALELQKPLVIHSRDAKEETLKILKAEGAESIGGVFHCFTYDLNFAKEIIELGFYIGISGIVTFKNAKVLREVVLNIPLSKILLETDAPYLAPEPYRGKPNMPAYLFYIAEYVAKLRGVSLELLARVTSENFFSLFKG